MSSRTANQPLKSRSSWAPAVACTVLRVSAASTGGFTCATTCFLSLTYQTTKNPSSKNVRSHSVIIQLTSSFAQRELDNESRRRKLLVPEDGCALAIVRRG